MQRGAGLRALDLTKNIETEAKPLSLFFATGALFIGGNGLGSSQSDSSGASGEREDVMKNLALHVKYFVRDERGATAVEYGILVALITVAVLIVVYAVGKNLEVVFNRIQRCLNNSSNCGA